MVTKACKEGHISSIKLSKEVKITHLLFVDDVIFFGLDNIEYWKVLHGKLETFCNPTGMEVNEKNPCIYAHKV